jgi:ABC-type transporter Mla MlaB component
MANNFKFLSSRIRERILLKLYGDFDGSAACELINFLKNYRNDSNQIFIDTNNLNTVHPFGMAVFKKNFSVLRININNINITGKNKFSLEQRWY